jgi:hypothetical protein
MRALRKSRVFTPALLLVVVGCGGRVTNTDASDATAVAEGGADADDAGADTTAPSGDAGDADQCVMTNGGLLCGGICSGCAGTACDALQDRSGGAARLGLCGYDDFVPKGVNAALCSVCAEGWPLCAGTPKVPICVTTELCAKADALGVSNVCWYQDKTPWSAGDVIGASACPGAGFCGGSCGTCAAGETCTGRSVHHPFGVCAPLNVADGSHNWCPTELSCSPGQACMRWNGGTGADTSAQRVTGFCIDAARCNAALHLYSDISCTPR